MLSYIVAGVIFVVLLVYGVVAGMANMMGQGDAPTAEGVSQWPLVVGLALAIVLAVGHHWGFW